MEFWKQIIGYEGLYEISSLGNVKRVISIKCKKERILKQHLTTTGYYKIGLFKGSKGKQTKIHRLIAIHFIPNPKKLKQVNHINGIKTDNRIENLEWVSHRENALHAIKLGLSTDIKGSNHFSSKLTELQVLDIRKEYPLRKTNCILFAKKYGITKSALLDIIARRRWLHI